MVNEFNVYYPIEKALFHIEGGNCSRLRALSLFKRLNENERKMLLPLVQYVNNSFFTIQCIYNWMLWRYVVKGLKSYPTRKEIDPKEISKSRKEFYGKKLQVDNSFLYMLCDKVGKDITFLNELNTDGESHLYKLFKAEKIGLRVLMERLEPNEQNQEQQEMYNRIQNLTKIIK